MSAERTYHRTEYPRPQFRRQAWVNLNSAGIFRSTMKTQGKRRSGIATPIFRHTFKCPLRMKRKRVESETKSFHPYVWCHRTFEIPNTETKTVPILRFQASDYLTKVWVNGVFVGEHVGGNAAFSFDITHAVTHDRTNSLVVKVEDSQSCHQPRGKQRWTDENFGCWYVQTTGIWQTVWLEFLPEEHIEHVKITPKIDENSVAFDFILNGLYDKPLKWRPIFASTESQ